jgi:hypothetical protein
LQRAVFLMVLVFAALTSAAAAFFVFFGLMPETRDEQPRSSETLAVKRCARQ